MAATAHRMRSPAGSGWSRTIFFRPRAARTTGRAIIRMGNQFKMISVVAMPPKAPATMPILVREKMVRKVLNRW